MSLQVMDRLGPQLLAPGLLCPPDGRGDRAGRDALLRWRPHRTPLPELGAAKRLTRPSNIWNRKVT